MLTAQVLLAGYAQGIFPMARSRDDTELLWFEPKERGVFPLDRFHISRSLARQIRAARFTVRTNTAFSAVVSACADRDETWINAPLARLYDELHQAGFAHSVEIWDTEGLRGGIFGITLAGAFFGESMVSLRSGGSKIALAFLIDRLRRGGFTLFDTQYLTPHLASLGAIAIPRAEYRRRLAVALATEASFTAPPPATAQDVLQRNSQMS